MKRVVVWLVILLALGSAALCFVLPYGPRQETFVDIPAGAGTSGIARRLERAGIIRSALAFDAYRVYARGTLHAGEYRFDHPLSLGEVYRKVARGEVYTKTLVIPEGFNIFDIAQAVETAGLGSAPDFLAAERANTSLIQDLDPNAASLEGYLFPDTYRFSRHAAPTTMLAAMVRRFRQEAARIGLANTPNLARTVITASLIEKEVNVDAERALVGGVFVNREAAGMPLATDPTVVYAALLNGRWRGVIYASDLQFDSPYNTYRHTGLPPGPIANPGVAALEAAMHPAKTDYLYFVADASGHNQFSVGLKEHDQQVQAYRKAAPLHP